MRIPAETIGRLWHIGQPHGLSVVETIDMLASERSLAARPVTLRKEKKRNV
jgi:hypothetical protein